VEPPRRGQEPQGQFRFRSLAPPTQPGDAFNPCCDASYTMYQPGFEPDDAHLCDFKCPTADGKPPVSPLAPDCMDTIDDCDMDIAHLPTDIFSNGGKGIDPCWKGLDGEGGFSSRASSMRGDFSSLVNSPRESPRHTVTYHPIDDDMM